MAFTSVNGDPDPSHGDQHEGGRLERRSDRRDVAGEICQTIAED
jgi:hypothetical protein